MIRRDLPKKSRIPYWFQVVSKYCEVRDGTVRAGTHHDAIIIMMRTTLNLPDDVHNVILSLAEAKGISMGDAVAELVRKSLQPSHIGGTHDVFPCFLVSEEARPITLADTLTAEDEA